MPDGFFALDQVLNFLSLPNLEEEKEILSYRYLDRIHLPFVWGSSLRESWRAPQVCSLSFWSTVLYFMAPSFLCEVVAKDDGGCWRHAEDSSHSPHFPSLYLWGMTSGLCSSTARLPGSPNTDWLRGHRFLLCDSEVKPGLAQCPFCLNFPPLNITNFLKFLCLKILK